jgi:hypothetical protein
MTPQSRSAQSLGRNDLPVDVTPWINSFLCFKWMGILVGAFVPRYPIA